MLIYMLALIDVYGFQIDWLLVVTIQLQSLPVSQMESCRIQNGEASVFGGKVAKDWSQCTQGWNTAKVQTQCAWGHSECVINIVSKVNAWC